jgi:hypothetical protein
MTDLIAVWLLMLGGGVGERQESPQIPVVTVPVYLPLSTARKINVLQSEEIS